jgi:hypothetical protein
VTAAGHPRDAMPAHGQCDGRLSPRADPVTGAPGWQVTTRSRPLAVAVAAMSGGTVHSRKKGSWIARIPYAVITVTVVGADAGALWCYLGARPDSGVFALSLTPWQAAAVMRFRSTEWPARGRLSVRDVQVTTRMGRTVRYLIPELTAA